MTYLDASVLAAYYCPEALSDQAESAILKAKEPLLSQLVDVELQSAVARKIREKSLHKADGIEILTRFRLHLDSNCYRRFPLESKHYDIAGTWISRFDVPLRTLDALHLAICFDANATLLTADAGLARAARHFRVNVQLISY